AAAMTGSPQTLLEKLAQTALDLCRAGSAGISVLRPGGAAGLFCWQAVAGQFARQAGRQIQRGASPCGTGVDRNKALIFSYPERHFNYGGEAIHPPIVEALVVPFDAGEKPAGTLWVIAHTPSRQFDIEDQRVLTRLSRFGCAAYQMKMALLAAEAD